MPLGTKVAPAQAALCYMGTQLPIPNGAQPAQFLAHVYYGQTVTHLSYCQALVLNYSIVDVPLTVEDIAAIFCMASVTVGLTEML